MTEQDAQNLAGMTLNERLWHAGILDRWDAAVRRRDRDAMLALLRLVGISNPQRTADAVLAAPAKYGF